MSVGAPKKQETYQQQAIMHDDPGKHAPVTKDHLWSGDTRDYPTKEEAHEARRHGRRSGSESNKSRKSRGY